MQELGGLVGDTNLWGTLLS